jgi:hypothetical protein
MGYTVRQRALFADRRSEEDRSSHRPGWRKNGEWLDSPLSIIRLLFDEPQRLERIWLASEEAENQHTEELVLRWSPDHGHSFQEIVRQTGSYETRPLRLRTPSYLLEAE